MTSAFAQVLLELASQSQVSQLILDTVSHRVFFVGKADLGISYSDLCWQIALVTQLPSGDLREEYPNGVTGFTFSWLQRKTYTYLPLVQEPLP